jgi:hypothetical protein
VVKAIEDRVALITHVPVSHQEDIQASVGAEVSHMCELGLWYAFACQELNSLGLDLWLIAVQDRTGQCRVAFSCNL